MCTVGTGTIYFFSYILLPVFLCIAGPDDHLHGPGVRGVGPAVWSSHPSHRVRHTCGSAAHRGTVLRQAGHSL